MSKSADAYYAANRTAIMASNRARYHADIEASRAYYRGRYHANKGSINKATSQRWRDRRREIIRLLGGRCVRCGIADERVLQVDHKNGGGSRQRRTLASSTMQKYQLGHLDEFQLLCANDHMIKTLEDRNA